MPTRTPITDSFPSLPLHCIEWARDTFAGLFTAPFATAAAIAAEPDVYIKREEKNAKRNPGKVLAQLRPALAALDLAASATLRSLIASARTHWQGFFHNIPAQLIFSMPRDYPEVDDKGVPTGRPFW
jgi:ubiquitin-activating enzyme E1